MCVFLQGTAVFWYNLFPSGEGDYSTRHAACPVLVGNKWGESLSMPTSASHHPPGHLTPTPCPPHTNPLPTSHHPPGHLLGALKISLSFSGMVWKVGFGVIRGPRCPGKEGFGVIRGPRCPGKEEFVW